MAWCKKILHEGVACVCLTIGTVFLVIAFFKALGFLLGDSIICTSNWFIQISLEFRKWLVYKDLILKDTKLLSELPWPLTKQSTIFISSNSKLVFLTFSNLFANPEPLVCVVFVFWKELNECFLYFFLKSFFFAMLGILSTPLFLWLKSTARCTLSNTCPFFATTFPLKRYLKSVYRQSTCW